MEECKTQEFMERTGWDHGQDNPGRDTIHELYIISHSVTGTGVLEVLKTHLSGRRPLILRLLRKSVLFRPLYTSILSVS